MENLLTDMKALGVSKRTVAFIENGTWAPMAARHMQARIEEMKDMTILDATVTIKSALKNEQEAQLDALCEAVVKSLAE